MENSVKKNQTRKKEPLFMVNFFLNPANQKIYEELQLILDKYPEFKRFKDATKPNYNKLNNQNKFKTLKFKFLIQFCLREIKKNMAKNIEVKNVETNNTNPI